MISNLGTFIIASCALRNTPPIIASTSSGRPASISTSMEGLNTDLGFSCSIISSMTEFCSNSAAGGGRVARAVMRTSAMISARAFLADGMESTSPTLLRDRVQIVENDAFLRGCLY